MNRSTCSCTNKTKNLSSRTIGDNVVAGNNVDNLANRAAEVNFKMTTVAAEVQVVDQSEVEAVQTR